MTKRICSIDGCQEPHDARGWCAKHYGRWRNFGDPLAPTARERMVLDGQTRTEKPCSVCEIVQPLEAFSVDLRHSDGRQSRCLMCQRQYRHELWVATHPNYGKVSTAEERRENHRIASAKYRESNREVSNQRSLDWVKRHPEKTAEYNHKRRTVTRGTHVEKVNVFVLADRDNWICGICHKPIDPTLTYPNHGYRSVDHIIPIIMGGLHSYDNTRIAHWICNVRRGAARGENLELQTW